MFAAVPSLILGKHTTFDDVRVYVVLHRVNPDMTITTLWYGGKTLYDCYLTIHSTQEALRHVDRKMESVVDAIAKLRWPTDVYEFNASTRKNGRGVPMFWYQEGL